MENNTQKNNSQVDINYYNASKRIINFTLDGFLKLFMIKDEYNDKPFYLKSFNKEKILKKCIDPPYESCTFNKEYI